MDIFVELVLYGLARIGGDRCDIDEARYSGTPAFATCSLAGRNHSLLPTARGSYPMVLSIQTMLSP